MRSSLITGGSGFLGSAIYDHLNSLGIEVDRLARSNAEVICDLSVQIPKLVKPYDLIVHCAGKAHTIPKNKHENQEFYLTNVKGTQNLTQGIEASQLFPKAIIFISTVAVYGVSAGKDIGEDHPLQAQDPYGKSKIEAERLLGVWCEEKSVVLTIFRLPLLAGKNPPGNLKSMIKGIQAGYYFNIAQGRSRKSMVLVTDVAKISVKAIHSSEIYNLTDGAHPSFRDLAEVIARQLGVKKPKSIPLWVARLLGWMGDLVRLLLSRDVPITSKKVIKIVSTLTYNDEKARRILNWKPNRVVDDFRI